MREGGVENAALSWAGGGANVDEGESLALVKTPRGLGVFVLLLDGEGVALMDSRQKVLFMLLRVGLMPLYIPSMGEKCWVRWREIN